MRVGDIAGAVGRGLFAGAVGTAAMTVSSTLEAKLRGREPSAAPAAAAAKVLGVQPRNPAGRKRFASVVHWTYGTAWGGMRGLLDAAGLGARTGPLAHFVAVWGTEQVMLPALAVAPPVRETPARETAFDVLHHGVYVIATSLAYAAMQETRRAPLGAALSLRLGR
jgi:hypothetical protein